MDIQTNKQLSDLTTMRIGGTAHFVATVTSPQEVATVYQNAQRLKQNIMVLGGGSNVIAHDEGFDGVIVLNKIPGFEVIEDTGDSTTIKIGAGELWDSVVERSVTMGLSGIAALSAIPGTAGAAPVQNIGAYGQEIADTLVSLEAYDTQQNSFVQLSWQDCGFSYRHSIFRGSQQGRYVIVSITLKLYKATPQPPFYTALQTYLDEHNITNYTVQTIRDAVIAIRAKKLPDPAKLPNTGSFFKNAIVEDWLYNDLKAKYPDMPGYEMDATHHKIPTGWLIQEAGFKGQVINGMKVHSDNALVLINQSAKGYADLAAAREEIISTVRDTFRITIEQEPLEI
jgi:UDP-N-acetylmuramate dehydrogenase